MKNYKVFISIAAVLFLVVGVAMMLDKKILAYVTFLPAAVCFMIGWKQYTNEKENK